jgi:hypothetical protein
MFYSDRPSEDEELLIRPLLRGKNKNTIMEGGLNLNLTFCFMERNY